MVDRERPRVDDEARETAPDAREEAPRATRRRGRELLNAIHEAVILEAADVGVARLSMEGIARRAGTAKTSLYRRWPTPGDILLDAMYHTYPQEAPTPGADDLRGDLVRALMLLRDTMSRSLGQAMFSVVAEARHHPELYDRFVREVFDSRGGASPAPSSSTTPTTAGSTPPASPPSPTTSVRPCSSSTPWTTRGRPTGSTWSGSWTR